MGAGEGEGGKLENELGLLSARVSASESSQVASRERQRTEWNLAAAGWDAILRVLSLNRSIKSAAIHA